MEAVRGLTHWNILRLNRPLSPTIRTAAPKFHMRIITVASIA
jgi:hypothetical protein